MKTIVKTLKHGDKIRSEDLGIQGKVVGLLDYNDIVAGLSEDRRNELDLELRSQLGEDYKEKYYEAVVAIHYCTKASTYDRGERAVFTWRQLQDCDRLA